MTKKQKSSTYKPKPKRPDKSDLKAWYGCVTRRTPIGKSGTLQVAARTASDRMVSVQNERRAERFNKHMDAKRLKAR